MVRAWAKPSSSLGPTRRRSIYIEDGTDRQDKLYGMSCLSAFPAQQHPTAPGTPRFWFGTPAVDRYYWFGGMVWVVLKNIFQNSDWVL